MITIALNVAALVSAILGLISIKLS